MLALDTEANILGDFAIEVVAVFNQAMNQWLAVYLVNFVVKLVWPCCSITSEPFGLSFGVIRHHQCIVTSIVVDTKTSTNLMGR